MSKIKRSKKEKIFLILVSCVILCVAAGMITTLLWGYPVRYRNAESIFEELSEKGYMENEVLLIGSSFMEYWSTSAEDLSPLTTYNMGVASTVVSDWSKWIDKFILPFKPRAIVVYVGSNDMSGGVGSKSGEAVAQELKEFFSDIREKLQNTEIYYVSV
ncbi:MAG: hypothetical protein LBQ27_05920, partial [Clostridiales bacterium]|nr:hypothetical protein [Clostridiales bacterium]